MHWKIFLILIILFVNSCKKDINPDYQILNTGKDLVIATSNIPQEPQAATELWARRILFYKSLTDRQQKKNCFAVCYTEPGFYGSARRVLLKDVACDSVYLRIESVRVNGYGNGYYDTGVSFYCKDMIRMSPYKGQTLYSVETNNLVTE